MKKFLTLLLALSLVLTTVAGLTVAAADTNADIELKTYAIDPSANSLTGSNFKQTQETLFSVSNGTLSTNGQKAVYGLALNARARTSGTVTVQFDIESATSDDNNPWMATFFGLRYTSASANATGAEGITFSIADNKLGVRTGNWPEVTIIDHSLNFTDFTTLKFVDDQDKNVITVYTINSRGNEVKVVEMTIDGRSFTSKDSDGVTTRGTLPGEPTKGGYITWWVHNLSQVAMKNISAQLPVKSAAAMATPTPKPTPDPSKVKNTTGPIEPDYDNETIKIMLDTHRLMFDVEPQIINDRTMVPMRTIFEALDSTVSWDQATQTVTAVKDDTTIELVIGADTAKKNGEALALDSPATIVDDRTLVPLRFISESLGLTVEWDGRYKLVTISSYRDTKPDTWVAIDDQDRESPMYFDVGIQKEDKHVLLFYYIWDTSRHLGSNPIRDITKIRQGQYDWLGVSDFHYWGEPFMGYYDTMDPFIIRKHAQMLTDAGIDAICFDMTNAIIYEEVVDVMLETYEQIKAEGGKVPKMSFLLNSAPALTARKIYDRYFNPETSDVVNKYADAWYYWMGKPLMMVDQTQLDPISDEDLINTFTMRASWAWTEGGKDKWPWLEHTPQHYGWHYSADFPEQIVVQTAQHPGGAIGKSYQNKMEPSEDQFMTTTKQGRYFEEQWQRAYEVGPQIVFITQWNEWIAQRFIQENDGVYALNPIKAGDTYFVDVYSWEFNRDIEPMRNDGDYGYGDNYYYQMAFNIRKFKGVRPAPEPSAQKTIDIAGSFDQWTDVKPEFLDDIGDTMHRDFKSSGKIVEDRTEDEYYYVKNGQGYYRNTTGRNDIEAVKIAHDTENVYFYVKTVDDITSPESTRWMNLLINTNKNWKDGYHGFDYMLNRSVNTAAGTGSLEKSTGGFSWKKLADVAYTVEGNQMMVSIPKSAIGLEGVADMDLRIEFKWFDNVPYTDTDMDIMDFIDKGDTAPNARFAYRYTYDPETP